MRRLLIIGILILALALPAQATWTMKGSNLEDFNGWRCVGGGGVSVYAGTFGDDVYYGRIYGYNPSKYCYFGVNTTINYLVYDNPGWDYTSGYMIRMKHDASGNMVSDGVQVTNSYSNGYSCSPDRHGNCTISRFEWIWNGTYWNKYKDGVWVGSDADTDQAYSWGGLAYNNQYGYQSHYTLGQSHPNTISTIPHNWYLLMDMVDPSLIGLYDNNGVGVYVGAGTKLHFKYGLAPYANGASATYSVQLKHVTTGTVYANYNLSPFIAASGRYGGVIESGVLTSLINASAPFGMYEFVLYVDGSPEDLDWFWYIADGATVWWDQDTYSMDDEPLVSWEIAEAYWDTSSYDYEGRIVDINGNVMETWEIISRIDDHELVEDISTWTAGEYFVLLYATSTSTDLDYLMHYDLATLTDQVIVEGQVIDASTGTPKAYAQVNMFQSDFWQNIVTNDTAYYTYEDFTSLTPITFNVTNITGYSFEDFDWTPQGGGRFTMDLYILPNYAGSNTTIRGIAYDNNSRQGVPYATINISNATLEANTTTNNWGFYQFEGEPAAEIPYCETNYTADYDAGGAVTQSSYYSSYYGSNAFDESTATYWRCNTDPSDAVPCWVKYDYSGTDAYTISRYSFYTDSATHNPKNWTFQGSNDDAIWDVLDTQNDIGQAAGWRSWNISTPAPYQLYRLNITADNGGTYTIIKELNLTHVGTDVDYTYALNGTKEAYDTSPDYNVTLSGTSASQSTGLPPAALHTVTRQDIGMTGRYNLTVEVYDEDSLVLITAQNVTISLDDDQNITTMDGTHTFAVDYGIRTVSVVSSGYYPTSQNVFVYDPGGTTLKVYLTQITEAVNPAIQPSPPHPVRFSVRSAWGRPITDCDVTCQGVDTTLGDWSWMLEILGIDTGETPIHNASMSGTTDFRGEIDFMMVEEIQYNCTFFKSGEISRSILVYPHDSQYIITAEDTGWFDSGYSQEATANVSVTKTEINTTAGNITFVYQDALGQTGNVNATVLKTNSSDAMGAWVPVAYYNTTGSSVNHTFTVDHEEEGTYDYFLQVNASHTTFGEINKTFGIGFTMPNPFEATGIPMIIWVLLGMVVCMFTGALFGATNAAQGALIVCIEAWILTFIQIFSVLGAIFVICLTLATVVSLVAVFRDYMRGEGYP